MYICLTVLLFLIYPLYSLPSVFFLIYKKKKVGFILLAIFLAVLAFELIPKEGMDLESHYQMFSRFSYYNLSDVYERWGNKYFVMYSYAWSVINLGFPKELVPFSVTLVGYLIFFKIFFKIASAEENKKGAGIVFILFLIILLNDHFWGLASGLRSALAFHIFIAGMYYCLYENKKNLFYFCSVIAIIIHPASLVPFLLFQATAIAKSNRFYRVILFLSVLFFVLSELFYSQLTAALKPFLVYFDLYTDIYFDVNGLATVDLSERKSFQGYIYSVLFRGGPYYLMLAYLFLVKDSYDARAQRFYNFLCLFVFMLSSVSAASAVYHRYVFFFTLAFCFYLCMEIIYKPSTKFKKIFVALLLITEINYNLGTLYSYVDVVIPMLEPFFYKPLPFILLLD